jgi:hypothetical protein
VGRLAGIDVLRWRFDQGRLEYLQFDEIRLIAAAIVELDGIAKPKRGDPDLLRDVLAKHSSLPFAPDNYYVWRNYSRVFACELLASEVAGLIRATDLAKQLAVKAAFDSDDYFAHFANNFYYPSPAFEGYQVNVGQVFPVLALIKFLTARVISGAVGVATLEEVARYLVGNQVTGLEPIAMYSSLNPTKYTFEGDEVRQARELFRFVSQFSFLKWNGGALILDVASHPEAVAICEAFVPNLGARVSDADLEIQRLGSVAPPSAVASIASSSVEALEREFTEGSKTRVTHLRTERSSELKKLYFEEMEDAATCGMCEVDTAVAYPWAPHVIEIHHLLPLASPLRVEKGTTSLKDVVGLCPSCHRATHKYYSVWLKKASLNDFRSYDEAREVFDEACAEYVSP